MLNLQEIFDKVAVHLMTQGSTSKEGYACMYRDNHGRMCAVGVLIPDDKYDPAFDSGSLGGVVNAVKHSPTFVSALVAGGVNVSNPSVMKLLQNLQFLHDSGLEERWKVGLQAMAEKHLLNSDAIKDMRVGK